MRHTRDSEPRAEGNVRRRVWAMILPIVCGLVTGCAALTNPAAEGVPVRLVPPELLIPEREGEHTIPLDLLGQPHPPAYRLAPGDVLGVHIEGFLGGANQPIPLHVSPPLVSREQRRLPPAAGYPIEVQADGRVALPRVEPVQVSGLTVADAREVIRNAYVSKQLLKRDDLVLVTLLQSRQYQVAVFRQEVTALPPGADGVFAPIRRGTGLLLDLPAYENDVLHALALTGGLPGLDACNEVLIFRNCFRDAPAANVLLSQAEASPKGLPPPSALPPQPVVRIPLRLPPGHPPPPLRPEDVLLQTGDVVLLEMRHEPVFYTGGLLPPGIHQMPRDHDLDVIEAMAQVRGPLINGAFGGSNLSGTLIAPGIGNPSPTQLTVLRKTPGGGQVPILVDLAWALQDSRERIVVKAGDVLILQEKPEEALTRYVTQTFFNFNLAWQVLHERFATGIIDVSAPDRLPGRLPNYTINR